MRCPVVMRAAPAWCLGRVRGDMVDFLSRAGLPTGWGDGRAGRFHARMALILRCPDGPSGLSRHNENMFDLLLCAARPRVAFLFSTPINDRRT